MNKRDEVWRRRASVKTDCTSDIDLHGMSSTAISIDSLRVDCHRGMRPARVKGKHGCRTIQLLFGWGLSSRPSIGWLPLMGIITSVEWPKGLMDKEKSPGTPVSAARIVKVLSE